MTGRERLNRVLAIVLVVWGAGMVVSGLAKGAPSADSAYSGGQMMAFVLGFVCVGAGLWTLFKKRPS
jgi:uncharacterized membrane protein